jgi:hypothetical protein
MVQVETSQLIGECNSWRANLRKYREEFTQDKAKLQQAVGHQLSKERLQVVEHLHNQFHIQLINIHDLKQSIKTHDRKAAFEMSSSNGVSDETLAVHENLFEEYSRLDQTLSELRDEFNRFLDHS